MAQYKMNAYDADVFIPRFKGLISNGNDPDGDLQYAVKAENVDTTDGFLQPTIPLTDIFYVPYMPRVSTLEYFFLREDFYTAEMYQKLLKWYTGGTIRPGLGNYKSPFNSLTKVDFNINGNECYALIVTGGNGIAMKTRGVQGARTHISVNGLIRLDGTLDTEYREDYRYDEPETSVSHWEIVTSQSVSMFPPEEFGELLPVAVYLSCVEKGLYVILFSYQNSDLDARCVKIETPVRFAHIEAYGERLWACGEGVNGESLFYSAVYNPTDWRLNTENPELGAGQIDRPSWDGDHFTALKQFGDSLIAFKKNRILKINGLEIASLYITEQYGFGTEFVNTIVSARDYLIFANRNGLAIYDGGTARPIMLNELRTKWMGFAEGDPREIHAALLENRKYVVVRYYYDGIVYDLIDGTLLDTNKQSIISFCHPTSKQENLVLANGGNWSHFESWDFNGWENDLGSSSTVSWQTPWIELGRKDLQKGGFDFYFTPEVKGENPVRFDITFSTEKKLKTKSYTAYPMTQEEITAGKHGKTKRLHFGGSGRRFFVHIYAVPRGGAAIWRLYGGIHIIAEVDKD